MFEALSASDFAQWVAVNGWAYGALLSAHGLGMGGLVGITTITALRILGFPRGVPLGAYVKIMPFAIIAFAMNALSGIALFVADAASLVENPSFLVKIGSIVVGVIVLTLLYRGALRQSAALLAGGQPDYVPTGYDKTLAIVAVLIWLGAVIVSGRLIAYLAQVPA